MPEWNAEILYLDELDKTGALFVTLQNIGDGEENVSWRQRKNPAFDMLFKMRRETQEWKVGDKLKVSVEKIIPQTS